MTPEQRLHEVRKALAIDDRLARLIVEVGQDFANKALRKLYMTNEPGVLIRQSGLAEGSEQFVAYITKAPSAAQDDRPE